MTTMRWQYFTVAHHRQDPLDPAKITFGRRDLDGRQYNAEMLMVGSGWKGADILERYYLLGSNDKDLTDITEQQAAHLISEAVRLGRYEGPLPDEPRT